MASGPITSWQIDEGNNGKEWQTLFFGAAKSLQMVTAAEKLRHLLIERKVMTKLDSILKSRDIALPTKVHLVKAVFPVPMCGFERWTIKRAEHWRIDAFELWCWRRLLRVPWMARGSNQSILKEISPEYSLKRLMLKLKLQYFTLATWCDELTHWKRPWCWERFKEEEKGMTEDEIVGWHHRLNRHDFE